MTERNVTEADRLIAAALADHRVAAPKRLRERLERRYLARGPARWPWAAAFALGAAAAAAIALLVLRPAGEAPPSVAREAVGDHLRILVASHPLDVEASDMHQVKPWFAGRLEFVPPVTFLGDDEFPLRGGDLVVFLGHKAAAFVYGRRLHVISLFVFPEPGAFDRGEAVVQGFHVITWQAGDVGMALVSDVGWDDLRALEARLRAP